MAVCHYDQDEQWIGASYGIAEYHMGLHSASRYWEMQDALYYYGLYQQRHPDE